MVQRPTDTEAEKYLEPWGINQNLEFVRGVENFVYKTKDGEHFLRLTQPQHRKAEKIENEIKWINHLHNHGVSVAQALKNKNERYVEIVQHTTSPLTAVVFECAVGRVANKKEDFTPTLLRQWGKYTGQLHSLTKGNNSFQRLHWNEEPGFILAQQSLDTNDQCFHIYQQIKEYLFKLPKDNDSYGLIHADLHTGNFFIDEDSQLTTFDFDDSQYNWFVYDLAVIMSSLGFLSYRNKWNFNLEELWNHLLQGYLEENSLTIDWLNRVPVFVSWRNVSLYFWMTTRLKKNDFLVDDINKVIDMKDRLKHSLMNFTSSDLC